MLLVACQSETVYRSTLLLPYSLQVWGLLHRCYGISQHLIIVMINILCAATGAEVVVEEFLDGEEASFFALVDGPNAVALASAQDHKAAGDGDTGPNTGGMGAYSPAPVVTPQMEQQVGHSQGGKIIDGVYRYVVHDNTFRHVGCWDI